MYDDNTVQMFIQYSPYPPTPQQPNFLKREVQDSSSFLVLYVFHFFPSIGWSLKIASFWVTSKQVTNTYTNDHDNYWQNEFCDIDNKYNWKIQLCYTKFDIYDNDKDCIWYNSADNDIHCYKSGTTKLEGTAFVWG